MLGSYLFHHLLDLLLEAPDVRVRLERRLVDLVQGPGFKVVNSGLRVRFRV